MRIDRRSFLAFASAAAIAPAIAQGNTGAPQGRIEALEGIAFDNNPVSRIRIWLPPGYDESDRTYRVLYMLDGQYVFATDSDGLNFAADHRMAKLAAAQTIQPALIVAIDNLGRNRFLQYMPQTIYDRAEGDLRTAIDRELARHQTPQLVSAQFVQFVTTRLKPFIDANYRTLPGRLDTAIFGASMAGAMAGALFVEAQETFGLGCCMSPNWAIYDDRFIDYPQLLSIWPAYFGQLGAPVGRRLWLDHGTEMMDAGMAPHQIGIAQRLTQLGWENDTNLQARVYQNAGHAFAQTAVQMDEVLTWLLV